MADGDKAISQKVDEYGWAVVHVGASGDEPNYAYSVGLFEKFGHPEVIVFGLHPDVLQDMINRIGDEVKQGKSFAASTVSSDLLEGYPCAFRPVAAGAVRAYMGAGLRYYARDFPAVHCVWPDRQGRFPWDSGASADFRRLQPMLSEGPEASTRVRP